MKGTLLGAAFLALVSVNLHAQDQTNQLNTDSTTPAAQQPAAQQPAAQQPAAQQPAAQQPAAQQPAAQQPAAQQPAAQQPAAQQPAAQQPAAQQPAAQQPAAQQPAPQKINCEYNISPDTKTIDNALVVEWAKHAASQSFDFDHSNLEQKISKLEACYTEQGWKGFNDALEKSGNINAIKKQNLMVSSHLVGDAEITALKDNQWKVTMPLQVVYQSPKEKLTQLLNVTLNIARKPNGNLGIMQLIAMPKQTNAADQKTVPTEQPSEMDTITKP